MGVLPFILKGLSVRAGIYFLQPLLFLARDHLIDWLIRRYILTEALIRAIEIRANGLGFRLGLALNQTNITHKYQ